MNCQFSFGPHRSYFCSADTVYAWSDNNLPRNLARILEDSAHPQALDTPYDLAFPMEPGTYTLCWKTVRGEDCYEDAQLSPPYARLARFIKKTAAKGTHTSRTVFGPNFSFFSMSASGYCWQSLPPRSRRTCRRAYACAGQRVSLWGCTAHMWCSITMGP
ncbi:hypothetical protein B0H19DRAFT_1069568 [Mycena capillaripes]|nr:hypothetical protein B0H19DRAFT_1069568 [Mycena capillaripes]